MNLILNIYDDEGRIAKQHKSTTYDLMFGTVMKLMDLLKIEDIDNQMEMLKTIYSAWDEIKLVLSGVFPDATDDDWKHVKVKELMPLILDIAKFSVTEMFSIPKDDSKN